MFTNFITLDLRKKDLVFKKSHFCGIIVNVRGVFMFAINEMVVHYRDGLAQITGETEMEGKEYYLLKAYRGDGTTFYVPKDNAIQTIRPIMDIENADGILAYMKNLVEEFNANTKKRRDDFKRRIASGNILDIAYLVKQLYLYRHTSPEEAGAKFGPVDFSILEKARDMIYDELAVVYGIDRSQVSSFVEQRMASL